MQRHSAPYAHRRSEVDFYDAAALHLNAIRSTSYQHLSCPTTPMHLASPSANPSRCALSETMQAGKPPPCIRPDPEETHMTHGGPDVLTVDRDGVLHVTINRPELRNPLSAAVISGIEDALAYVLDRPSQVRALVLRGAGGIFCAGGDLKELKAVLKNGGVERSALVANSRRAGALFAALDRLPAVVIAAVEGAAMGGGVGLAAVADVTLATVDTRFALTETSLGILPAQISPFVVARIGQHHARALTLTAARIDAEQAYRIGLVDRVVADAAALDAAVEDAVAQVRRCAPRANTEAKSLLHLTSVTPLDDLLDIAAEKFADALLGDEAREGVQAFLAKGTPRWRGAK